MTVVRNGDRGADRKGRRRWLRWAALVLLLAYGVTCWVAAGRLLTPTQRVPRALSTADATRTMQDVELLTSDGLRLAAWVLEPEGEALGTVLLFHGKDGCRQPERLRFAAARGFRALAIDERAHGASEGEWTTFGWYERHDVRAAWSYARQRWPDEPLIAWGTSQGAAAVVYFVEEFSETDSDPDPGSHTRRPFDGLILESLYVDVDTAFRNRVRRRVGGWALPLAWPVRWMVAVRSGIDPARLDPAAALGRMSAVEAGPGGTNRPSALAEVPILVAAGTEDAYATPAEAEQIVAALAPGQARLVLVPGRRHEDLLGGGETVWTAAIDGFLARFRQ